MADINSIVADITLGRLDDELVAIAEALETRSRDVVMAWSVRWPDGRVDKTDVDGHGITVKHALRLGEIATDVRHLNPAGSDLHRMAVPIAFYMADGDVDLKTAEAKVAGWKLDEIVVVEYVERDVPKDRSTPEAPGS